MPQHPSEENTESHIFDKVAKESDNSTASDHRIHQEGSDKASAAHYKSKGPQISDNMPEAKSKEELKARAAELNK